MKQEYQDKNVPIEELLDEGYRIKGNYAVQRIGDKEVMFIEVAHGKYAYYGERDYIEELEGELLFQ